MDVIAIRGMRVHGRHGANPGERDREQPFDVNIEMDADLQRAAASDDLSNTIDYADVSNRIRSLVQTTSFALLERLAQEVLNALFEDARIFRARVEIAKPQLLDGATPSISLTRDNPRYKPS